MAKKNETKGKSKQIIKTVNFKRKRFERKHPAELIQDALNYIGKGHTIRQAADKYGIAKSTLYVKLTNRYPILCKKGPSTVLTLDEENDIAEWIIYSASRGFPITKRTLEDNVQKYLNSQKRKTVFKNNRPGRGWYSSFFKRYQQLSSRITQNLTTSRTSVTENNLKEWFSTIKNHLKDKRLLNVDPSRIFNLDESAFMLIPKKTLLADKGSRTVYRIVSRNERAYLTALFNVSASGVMVPPMILFDLKNTPKKLQKPVFEQIPEGWSIRNSERAWMTSDIFYNYITNVFFKWLQENDYEFPIVLYVDGNFSHLTISLMKFCKQEKIELIALFPNATRILQPLDVAVFHPVKEKYKEILRQWRIDNNVTVVKKSMFAPVLKLTLDSIDLTNIIKNGFRTCGLYPFDENAINYSILPKEEKRKNSIQENDCTSPSNNYTEENDCTSPFNNSTEENDYTSLSNNYTEENDCTSPFNNSTEENDYTSPSNNYTEENDCTSPFNNSTEENDYTSPSNNYTEENDCTSPFNNSTEENDCTSPSNNLNHSNQILSIFENEILSSDDLELFRAHESDDFWTGDIKFEKLFTYWKKLKGQNGI